VSIEEGSAVRAGQTIAVLVNADYAAQVASARATLQERQAALRRVVNGARTQERLEAQAAVEEADAILGNALAERDRRRDLLEQGAISRDGAGRAGMAGGAGQEARRGAAVRAD
jgi:multidrug resistance efflux pump